MLTRSMRVLVQILLVVAVVIPLGLLAPPSSRANTRARAERLGFTTGAEPMATRAATGYRRGRKTRIELVSLGWAEVEVSCARAFLAMAEAAAEAGIDLAIRSGYRSHEQQTWLYQAYRAGWGNVAARPGHSLHQSGRALDLDVRDPDVLAWLDRNARRFGFRRTVRSEPWHWEFRKPPRRRARKKRGAARTPRASASRGAPAQGR